MKLAAHYNRTNIFITVTVLLAGAIIYFFAINFIARSQLDNDLSEEVAEVVDYVTLNHKLPKQVDFDEDQTTFIKTNSSNIHPRFFDTIYVNPKEKQNEPGRAVETVIKLNDQFYKVIITVSRESTEYLLQFIGLITLALVAALLFILFLANRYFLNGLWKPFYVLLYKIKGFNLSEVNDFKLKGERVDEFVELSTAIDQMSNRIHQDYQHLKHLTDNVSHEMLTPLAVITSKLDTLIQHELLPSEISEQIEDIYIATSRLSRMNQTLLLLARIENKLIADTEQIDLKEFLSDKIKQFNEITAARHIQVTSDLLARQVIANKHLVDILLNNLISNAIWHNFEHGEVQIILNEHVLIFQNTGQPLAGDEDRIFERFKKGTKSEGTGLGLALVKNICKFYGWEISYYYKNERHNFKIGFNY